MSRGSRASCISKSNPASNEAAAHHDHHPQKVSQGRGDRRHALILPPHLWAAETQPNSRLGIGFIGMGKQSRGLLSNFMNQDVQVLAVCDVDTTRREDAKKKVDDHYTQNPGKGTPG